MLPGKFITVEGADGAGKTTQLRFIERWLEQRGIKTVMTREPGGTGLGEALRKLLLNYRDSPICADAELLMMFAARAQHIEERIQPALAAGFWVVSDRFTDASFAYQGGGRGIPLPRLESLERWVQNDFQPDLTLLLDVPVAVGLRRAGHRGQIEDRFEQEAICFKESVRSAYLQRSRAHPQRIRVVDASGAKDAVQREISVILEKFCKKASL